MGRLLVYYVSIPASLPVYTGAHCAGPEEVTCLHHTFYYESTCSTYSDYCQVRWKKLVQVLLAVSNSLIHAPRVNSDAPNKRKVPENIIAHDKLRLHLQLSGFILIEALWRRVWSLLFTTLPLPKLDEIKMNRNKEHSQGSDRCFIGPADLKNNPLFGLFRYHTLQSTSLTFAATSLASQLCIKLFFRNIQCFIYGITFECLLMTLK